MPHGCQARATPSSYTWASRRQKFQWRGSSEAAQVSVVSLARVSTLRTAERPPAVTRQTPPVTPFLGLCVRGMNSACPGGSWKTSRTSSASCGVSGAAALMR